MRWRALITCRVMVDACLAGILMVPSSLDAQSKEAESAAVYRAVLDMLYTSGGDAPDLIIVADSLHQRNGGVSYGGRILVPYASMIDKDAIVDFERVTSISAGFPADLSYRIPIVTESQRDRDALDSAGRVLSEAIPERERRDMPFWVGFADKYPRAWGFTVLSQVGFNRTKTQALLYIRHQCGGGCGSAETVFLRKESGGWKVAERIRDGTQESLGIGALRYLGPGAHMLADQRRMQDSTRRAIADSIERDLAPRRIRGTVVNRQTGRPLSFTQIFVRSAQGTPNPWARVVADSLGRYEVRNPPIGTTMLELQCAGSAYRPGATLDAPGFYVFPQLDTVIDMGPPNIQPCWYPRRIHAIQSGSLESGPHTDSPFPSDKESGVYTAVLRKLFPALVRDNARPILNASTHVRCGRHQECESLRIAHLARAGVVDSATVVDFKRKSQEAVPLNRRFAADLELSLLAPGERSYLSGEGDWIGYLQEAAPEVSGFWRALRTVYPGTPAIVSFTRPGFDRGGNQALVQVRLETVRGVGRAETIFLRQIGQRWIVARRHLENEIVSGELSGGKCLPTSPGRVPSYQELSEIRGDYSFTLVSNSGDGQVIDWRARFVRDTAAKPDIITKGLSPAQQADIALRLKFHLSVIEVIDVKTGERRPRAEPGTYLQSAGRYFNTASRMIQLDGSGMFLDIRRVAGDRLFGTWAHYSFGIPIDAQGNAIPEPAGHFCAVRRSVQ